MVTPFQKLFCEHVGAAFARQVVFSTFLGDRNRSLTLSTGKVRIGDDMEFPIQLLGSEVHDNKTWLWAWANRHIDPAPQSMAAVNGLRRIGKEQGIDEFSEPSFSLDVADGHKIAMVASGIHGCCYSREPCNGGAAFFLVTDVPDSLLAPIPPEGVITIILEVISQFEIDHRLMARSFLASQEFTLREEPRSVVASRDGGQFTLLFDAYDRLADIGAIIEPQSASKTKKWWEFWKS